MHRGLGFTLCVLAFAGSAAAARADELPVRWSPSLQLESLDRIDERWTQPVLKDSPIRFEKIEDWPRDDALTYLATADSCESYYALQRQGYRLRYVDMKSDAFADNFAVSCFTLHLLRSVRAAGQSFVGELTFDALAVDLLPPEVAESDRWEIESAVADNWYDDTRVSWREAWNRVEDAAQRLVVKTLSDTSTAYSWAGDRTVLSWFANGDFDGDGLEDVLVTSQLSIGGDNGELRLLSLTRSAGDRLFRIAQEFTWQMRDGVLPPLGDDWEIPWLAADAPSGLIPVRWAPTSGLAAPDATDAALAAPLYEDDYGYPVSREYRYDEETHAYEPVDDAEIRTCEDYFALIPLGYTVHYRDDFEKVGAIGRDCKLLRTMKRAQPSRVTYLDQFRLTRRAPYMMPMVDVCPGSESGYLESISQARRGVPWLWQGKPVFSQVAYDDPFSTTYHHEFEWGMGVELLARADFNADGIEDLLVRLDCFRTRHLSGNSSGSMLLTKLSETSPMILLEVPDE